MSGNIWVNRTRCLLTAVLLLSQIFVSGPLPAAPLDKDSQLIGASISGNMKQVKALLRRGAFVNTKGPDSKTPLLYAIEKDHPDVARLLISKGANPNFSDAKGTTPLMLAIAKGQKDVVKMLLDKGANVNVTQDTITPFISANNDTAILVAGVLTAGEYFGGDLKDKALQIYKNVNWKVFLDTNKTVQNEHIVANPYYNQLYHAWTPEITGDTEKG